MSLEKIGIITKPQGLKGEFRVKTFTLDFSVFSNLDCVFVNNVSYHITKCARREGFLVLKVDGVDSIEQAENLRGEEVFKTVSEFRALESDEYFVEDLVGADVFVAKNNVGKILSIENFGAADVFTVEGENGNVYFPNARNIIVSFDKEKKIVLLNELIFSEISL